MLSLVLQNPLSSRTMPAGNHFQPAGKKSLVPFGKAEGSDTRGSQREQLIAVLRGSGGRKAVIVQTSNLLSNDFLCRLVVFQGAISLLRNKRKKSLARRSEASL